MRCWTIVALIILLVSGIFSLLLVPSVEDAFSQFAFANFSGWPLTLSGVAVILRHFTYCLGDYLGCVKNEFAEDLVKMYSWEGGVGQLVPFSVSLLKHGYHEIPVFFSHASYRSWAHDAKAGRPKDIFVFTKKVDLPNGVLPNADPEILLNFDTGTPEHLARRKLLADALPALANTQAVLTIEIPPGVDANITSSPMSTIDKITGGHLKREVFDLVGYNLFKELFGVDISDNLEEHFQYDTIFAPGVIGIPVSTKQGEQLSVIRSKIAKKVTAGKIAQQFLSIASKKGMDGPKRLEEIIWIAMFAGYGGTGNLAFETVKFMMQDVSKFVPLFTKNPRAFMLEAARLHPPVGGMNPVAYRGSVSHKLGNGVNLNRDDGDIAILLSSGANMDPTVFKDPHNFRPGRPNAEKLLSWNNELDAFASCENIAGCPAAPRGCPGTWLSLRLATSAVEYFVKGMKMEEAAKGKKKDEM